MNQFPHFDSIWCIQEAMHTTSALAVMVDATFRSIDEMYHWKYTTKDEMKHLGGTLNEMQWKLREFLELGCAKFIEDALNNANAAASSSVKIWDSDLNDIRFCHEVRRTRHISNVIKHNNSVVSRASNSSSAIALIDTYEFPDETPLHYANHVYRDSLRDYLLTSIFHCHCFSFDLFTHLDLLPAKMKLGEITDIPQYMLNRFVHNLPGHPHKQTANQSE